MNLARVSIVMKEVKILVRAEEKVKEGGEGDWEGAGGDDGVNLRVGEVNGAAPILGEQSGEGP